MTEKTPMLSVVIPAFNEVAAIAGVVHELERSFSTKGLSFEIIVVDNGSTDGTGFVLEELQKKTNCLKVVHVFPNKGYGNGILKGLTKAEGDILGWIDADGQSSAEDVAGAYHLFLRGEYDVCKGIRRGRMDSAPRLIQSRVYNVIFRALFHVPYSDINAKPKFFTRAVYDSLELSSEDFFIDAELIIKAARRGYAVGELPVKGDARRGGSSKVRITTALEFIENLVKYWFKYDK